MSERIKIDFGERREVTLQIKSCDGSPFSVKSAVYDLIEESVSEASGEAQVEQIDDDTVNVTVLIQPKIPHVIYTLKFTYEIGEELLIHYVYVST